MGELDQRDRALAFRLAMGAVAAQSLLDELIDSYARRPSSLQPQVRDALRLACFEACWLETPPQVVVSQGVELVRSVAPRTAGLANAVLRRVVEQDRPRIRAARERCAQGKADVTIEELRLASALPAWLVERLAHDRSVPDARAIARGILEPAPVTVATNRMAHTPAQTEGLLAAAGLAPQVGLLPGSFELGRPAGLAGSGLVEATDVIVADVAAQLVARLVAPPPGSRVLEIGQGRGTKTLLLQSCAHEMGGVLRLTGVDSEPFKVELARERMARVGLSHAVTCHVLDGRTLGRSDLPEALSGPFDLVFVDAPCSGTGTMRRHPEVASALEPRALDARASDSLPALQLALVRAAAERVAAGGTLAYATCSALRVENEEVVRAFLASPEGARFTVVPVTTRHASQDADRSLARTIRPWVTDEGFLLTGLDDGELCPADTHFLALLTATR